jgi:hypothetical protein
MIAHDVYRPIPPVTLRISVIHAGDSFTLDLPPDRLGGTIRAFECQATSQKGPLAT